MENIKIRPQLLEDMNFVTESGICDSYEISKRFPGYRDTSHIDEIIPEGRLVKEIVISNGINGLVVPKGNIGSK